jgi:hypothetical protein
MTPELDNRMAVIMGNKIPRNTGMASQFELRTHSESPDKTDTVMKCLKRIKLLLQEKREHVIDGKDKILSNAAPTVAAKSDNPFPNSSAKYQACGMLNHTRKTCAFKSHELANRTSHQWDYSPRGNLWATHNNSCLTIGYRPLRLLNVIIELIHYEFERLCLDSRRKLYYKIDLNFTFWLI